MLRIFSLFLLLIFISCSSDSGDGLGNNPNGDPGTFGVKIDGSNWNATQNFVFSSIFTVNNITSLSVSASKVISQTESEAIAIALSNAISGNTSLEDTYPLDGTAAASIAFTKITGTTTLSYVGISGEIVISDVTTENVIGSFIAVLQNVADENDKIAMTGGSFNAALYTGLD